MYARITNNAAAIIEILGNDEYTAADVTETSTLLLNWSEGGRTYLYELDNTGTQEDSADALPEIIEILNENGIAIMDEDNA